MTVDIIADVSCKNNYLSNKFSVLRKMSVSEMSFLRSENTQEDSNNSSASGNFDLQSSSGILLY